MSQALIFMGMTPISLTLIKSQEKKGRFYNALTTTGGGAASAEKLSCRLACACVSLATFAEFVELSSSFAEGLLEPTSL